MLRFTISFSIARMGFALFGFSPDVTVVLIIGICGVAIAFTVFVVLLVLFCCCKGDYSAIEPEPDSNDLYRLARAKDTDPSGFSKSDDPLFGPLI
jgi:hypothetical protein